jgi:hypothetical protein
MQVGGKRRLEKKKGTGEWHCTAPHLGGVGRENSGEAVEHLGAASLGVDQLGLRDGERDGVGTGGREAKLPARGLLGPPAWVLAVAGHRAGHGLAAVRDGADAEVHLEALLLLLSGGGGGGSGRRGDGGCCCCCCFLFEQAGEGGGGLGFRGGERCRGRPRAAGWVPADGGGGRRGGRLRRRGGWLHH